MKNIYKLLCIPLIVSTLGADSSRAEKWEFFFNPLYMDSKSITFDGNSDISGEANVNSYTGFGFGFGYNVNEYLELSMLFTSSSSTYDITLEKDGEIEKDRSNLYMGSFNLAATYNLIDGPLTPYITGTFGSTYIDSGVTTGDTDWYCSPYYWYGGCYPYAETFGGTHLNYGGSVGIRYDFENALFLKAGIGKNWIDFDNASSTDFTVYDLTIGATF